MDWLKRAYYQTVSSGLSLISHTIGGVYAPWTHKGLDYDDVLEVIKCIQIGDIILTRTHGELTTAIIPGYWKHGAIYVGNTRVVESVMPYVREDWLVNLIMHTDNFAIMRVNGITEDQQDQLAHYAVMQIGKQYDDRLQVKDTSKVYCTEMVYHGVNKAMKCEYVELWMRMGYPSFTANDCYRAKKKFDVILEKRT